MYGLVNQGIEDLALGRGGPECWTQIKRRAGVGAQAFVGMDVLPDDVTYRLVDAAAAVLGTSREEVLEAFGEHWVLYTGRVGYGAVFDTMGATLVEFLGNLDAMHARLSLSMPALRPPSFACEPLDGERTLVRYWSHREGLAPMVVGLLRGLGRRFGVEVTVEHTLARSGGADHDEFLVTAVADGDRRPRDRG